MAEIKQFPKNRIKGRHRETVNPPDGFHIVVVVFRDGLVQSSNYHNLKDAMTHYDMYNDEPDLMYRQISSVSFEDARAGVSPDAIMNESKTIAD